MGIGRALPVYVQKVLQLQEDLVGDSAVAC